MIFNGEVDRYQGFHVNLKDVKQFKDITVDEFELSLKEALDDWVKKYRCSWFEVGLQLTHFLPVLAKFGYVFHHTKTEYVSMNKWLSPSEPKNVPDYAFTNIGVGGLVIDKDNRVLVVKERHNLGIKMWKFPGGYSIQGEEFGETAIREVREETGIDCQFESVIAFRHIHKLAFDCSDIYMVCHLKPLGSVMKGSGSLEISKCNYELDDCQWIPVDELRPQLSAFNRYILEKFVMSQSAGVMIGLKEIPVNIPQFKHIKQQTYSIHQFNKQLQDNKGS
ncbi:nucleoside diphosphate-linked moiety X motif 6-like [Oppia nitens]|uniref:nucleoside diphosphate-linked moiety X motif 6-like n=1 Tax=Oppia nitens TaxID=1686743 RepID=UPI0023DA5F4C|nr:nucleoside diphosphate-linked moiety X motif 6-like [Oppia nitens]XP_054155467.1 nucleoside diphosphate-linked moiety X motif 6-like [Oppia nitens]